MHVCMYVHMKLHMHTLCVAHVRMNDQCGPHLPRPTCYTVIHYAGCVLVDAYQASSAALGLIRRWRLLFLILDKRNVISTASCLLLLTGALCATGEWLHPATAEHSLQAHLLLIFLSILLQHGHSVQSEHRDQ